jgi:predicted regulator of Ras-like GTPase activity (Roadblock/LC7/MglB family)
MKMLKDCSEIREARDLLLRIMTTAPPAPAVRAPSAGDIAPAAPSAAPVEVAEMLLDAVPPDATQRLAPAQAAPPVTEPVPPVGAPPVPPVAWTPVEPEGPAGSSLEVESLVSPPHFAAVEEPTPIRPSALEEPPQYVSASRGERLHAILSTLCDHEGYAGAMVTDASGLPLATSRNLEASESLAAFSTVLGDVLTKAASYLGHDDASHVTLDVGERQKVVLRRFFLEERAFYLVVICLRLLETHRALGRTIPQIVLTLTSS